MTPDTVSNGGSVSDTLFPGIILESQPAGRARRGQRRSKKAAETQPEVRPRGRRHAERFDDDAEPFDGLG